MLVENYKLGDLARYGLGYDDLKDEFPALVYCSITGFGQTGPYAAARRLRLSGPGDGRDHEPDRRRSTASR